MGLKSPHIEAPFYENNPEDRIDAGVAKLMFDEEGSFKIARDAVIAQKPYPVKGFVTYKTNPAQTAANREKTLKMYDNLDFVLSMDITMSDTAWLADLVLPSQCALERTDPCSAQQGVIRLCVRGHAGPGGFKTHVRVKARPLCDDGTGQTDGSG